MLLIDIVQVEADVQHSTVSPVIESSGAPYSFTNVRPLAR